MASRRGPGPRDFRLVTGQCGSRLQQRSLCLRAWEGAASPGSARAVDTTRGVLSPGGDSDQQVLSSQRHRARAHALPERGGEFAGVAGRVGAGSARFFAVGAGASFGGWLSHGFRIRLDEQESDGREHLWVRRWLRSWLRDVGSCRLGRLGAHRPRNGSETRVCPAPRSGGVGPALAVIGIACLS